MAEEVGAKEEGDGKKRASVLVIVGVSFGMLLVGLGGGYFVAKLVGGGAKAPAGEEGAEGEAADASGEAAAEGGEEHAAAASEGGHGGEEKSEGGHEGGEKAAHKTGPQVVGLGSFTVNLRDSAGSRLLLMEIALECAPSAALKVEARDAQISDTVNLLAADYTFLELDGLDGRMRLKDELLRRINAVLSPDKCDRLYFTSFVVQ